MGENGKETIGDYELIGLIGDGAQGRVYRARCTAEALPFVKKDEAVALKVVRITGEDDKIRLKFQEQAEILRRLSHTNIVSYRDCFAWHAGEWDEAQCLVMELLEGEPLNERLKKAGTGLPWPQVEEIFEQCLAGLIHARERGITHRDIKPSNIFITTNGQAKLIDFDIARRDDSGQMSTAGWKGTFDYMAPDFITTDGFRGDEVSDIFSLGVCFYQALTGSLPYEPLGETAHIGYLNRWRGGASVTPSFRPGVFRVLSYAKNVITKALAVKREERYPTFAALLEDFRKIRYRRVRHKNKDEYELLAVLGRGGFGEVFKARRVSDGLLVAVKYLFSEKQSDRFIKEAKILQQYPHPNLVTYVDFMMLEGTGGEKQFFLVMEFLEGMPGWTLRHRIKNEGRLDVKEAVPLFGSYLSALQFLHTSARPIIHRDIKPGNLYAPMGQPEKAKIFDLGVARDVSGTVTVGGVPGTLDYMAPEFAEAGGDRGSPQSDLYALGLCLYEALVGKPVFERLPSDLNSAWLTFQDRIRKPPQIAFDDTVFAEHPRLRQVIQTALAMKPEGRHRSATEMRTALEDAIKPARSPAEDDAFDAGELTMATFDGSQPQPEPGATLGTRPLDVAETGGPGGLIAAGKREAERRKTRSRLWISIGAAAGVLLLLGGIITGVRRGGNNEAAAPARAPDTTNRSPAESKPSPTPPQTEAARLNDTVAATLAALPVRIAETADTRALTQLAETFVKLEAQPGITLRPDQVRAVEQALTEKTRAFAERYAQNARADYAAGRLSDGADKQKSLTDLAAATAPRFGKDAVEKLAADVETQRGQIEAASKKSAEETAARIARALDALNEFDSRVKKGPLTACGDGLALLSGMTDDVSANAALRVKWSATRDAYRKSLSQTLGQNDPLETRAERLKAIGDLLASPVAEAVFGAETAALRRELDRQTGVGVLRLVNRTAQPLRLSGKEIGDGTTLAGGASKEWALPVSGPALSLSFTVQGSDPAHTRTESVALKRAGGLERALTAVTPTVVATPATTPSPAPKPAPETVAQPVVVSAPPVQPAAPVVPPTAARQGAFDISVAPRIATVQVDGKSVAAGRIEVSANENHQVSVECKGYKPVQQYYKVSPGETRRIDILLEKEQKRSFFGL